MFVFFNNIVKYRRKPPIHADGRLGILCDDYSSTIS